MTINFENYGAFFLTLTYADGVVVDFYNPFTPYTAKECADFIDSRMNEEVSIIGATVCDWETGEIVATVERENEDFIDDEPSNIDDDCGFDPYLGCYSDDC